MERGTVTGRTNLVYQPNKDIRLDIGSTEEHALSVAVMFCLDGETEILTENGYIKIKDLNDKEIRVYTQNDKKEVYLTDKPVKVKETRQVKELYKITLENGISFKCTGNHKMKMYGNTYIEAKFACKGMYLIHTNLNSEYKKIQIKSVDRETYNEFIPVYDVINVPETNNFLIKGDYLGVFNLVSHNCLDGMTEVLTNEGYKFIKDLAGSKTNIYTYDSETGATYKENNINIIQNGEVNDLIEIELEDGFIIKCTPEHRFMLKNGEYKQAKDLTEQDELMDIDTNCGIYFIENKLNNKIYVGQSKNLKSRIESHKNNPVKLLKEDIEKMNQNYIDNINIYIAEYCNEDKLDERERYYIQLLNSEYPNGYNQQLGGKNHWEACTELKQKLQDNAKENLIGRVWMTNQKENIYVFENEVDYYLDSGYGYGKTNIGGNIK